MLGVCKTKRGSLAVVRGSKKVRGQCHEATRENSAFVDPTFSEQTSSLNFTQYRIVALGLVYKECNKVCRSNSGLEEEPWITTNEGRALLLPNFIHVVTPCLKMLRCLLISPPA